MDSAQVRANATAADWELMLAELEALARIRPADARAAVWLKRAYRRSSASRRPN